LPSAAWGSFGHDPQHTAISGVASQSLDLVRWQTPVDLAPKYQSDGSLLIHYGSPLVTPANTVVVPVKTGATGGFRVEGRSGIDGALKWAQKTDYLLPPHNWTPSFSPVLTAANRLYYPGAGGTVYYTDTPDADGAPVTGQLVFYGVDNYDHSYDSKVFINTPITADSAGNIYFGFVATGSTPLNLKSGIARISGAGVGTWVAASTAAGDAAISKVAHNCAPALSNDGSTLYVAVNLNNFGRGYLLALNSTTLATAAKVALKNPQSGSDAQVPDDGTASPTVGPDGTVYYGIYAGNHSRGFLLQFSGDLAQTKTPGSFGWDDTASVVPAAMVPSYQSTSSYLVMTKYNDYKEAGGSGINRLAVLDPNATQTDPITGIPVMKEVLTIAGVTPDPVWPMVREWCINTAAVDPATKSILVNSEDGRLYRWDLTTNTFTQSITLTTATGEAYTPTVVGTNGAVYAINNATLFAVQSPAGPVGLAATPVSNTAPVYSLRVTLSKPIAANSFTAAKVASFMGPGGPIKVNGVTQVTFGNNPQFDITFPSQTALGVYTMVIGPDIRDLANHPMDQNDNGIPGEVPGDQYVARFAIQGPKVLASTPSDNRLAPVGSVRVTFNEPMDAATFTPQKVVEFHGPGGPIDVTGVTPVPGSNNTQFDIAFDPQGATGVYQMLLGPDIRDYAGHQMDQNGNFIEGEVPGDLYEAHFGIQGPRVLAAAADSLVGSAGSVRVTFNEAIDPDTFTPDKVVSFTGPGGPVPVTAVNPVDGSGGTQFDITFDPQTALGTYTLVIGPDIHDLFGNAMDQNNNLVPGEVPGDQYTAQFTLHGPSILASVPTKALAVFPVDHVRVFFDEQIDAATFTPQKVFFYGPAGTIPVTGVVPVDGSNDTQFDITFPAQTGLGTYTMLIGPDIHDLFGNPMNKLFSAVFTIKSLPPPVGPDGFGYTAAVAPFQDLELLGQPDTFTVIDGAGPAAVASAVDLGSNTLNFYGNTYTGANQLYVTSAGLMCFGGAYTGFPTTLQSAPPQAAIAPLWYHYVKPAGDPTGPMVLGKFDDYDPAGVPHTLVLEWNQVRPNPTSPKAITFQAILGLNTAGAASDITFNYPDLNSGEPLVGTGTVGIKAAGIQGANRLVVSYLDPNNPFVADHQAILIHQASTSGSGGGKPERRPAPGPAQPGPGPLGDGAAPPLANRDGALLAAGGFLPGPPPGPGMVATGPTEVAAVLPVGVGSPDQVFASTNGRERGFASSRAEQKTTSLTDEGWLDVLRNDGALVVLLSV
jgi:hypothetical protein